VVVGSPACGGTLRSPACGGTLRSPACGGTLRSPAAPSGATRKMRSPAITTVWSGTATPFSTSTTATCAMVKPSSGVGVGTGLGVGVAAGAQALAATASNSRNSQSLQGLMRFLLVCVMLPSPYAQMRNQVHRFRNLVSSV